MKSIDHLHPEEQKHFIQCDCGEYFDMRNLAEVVNHFHSTKFPEPEWTYSVRIGEPVAHLKNQKTIDLN
jgi:hypothetical protein